MSQMSSPILLNLSGSYVIPVNGEKPKVGSVTGDLRLAALDAFLVSLNSALGESSPKSKLENTLVGAIKAALNGCSIQKHAAVTLAIVSKINASTNEMVYTFKVSTHNPEDLFPSQSQNS